MNQLSRASSDRIGGRTSDFTVLPPPVSIPKTYKESSSKINAPNDVHVTDVPANDDEDVPRSTTVTSDNTTSVNSDSLRKAQVAANRGPLRAKEVGEVVNEIGGLNFSHSRHRQSVYPIKC
jgi:hypothetical protein